MGQKRRRGAYFEDLSPSASPLLYPPPLPATLALFVVCGTTFGVPVVCTLSTPSVAVTSREEGVSVNCEFTLIWESEPDDDAEEDESDGDAVEAESRGEVGVEESEVTEEEEIAEAEVILDEEDPIDVLLPTDEVAAEDVADEDEEAPAPEGGNLSSASSLSFVNINTLSQRTHNSPVNAK